MRKYRLFMGSNAFFLDQTSILRARSAARSAARRVAAPLENFGLPREGYEDFSRGGAALRSSTGKTKVGLLLELITMVSSNSALLNGKVV